MPSRGPSVPETPPGPRSTAEPEKETLVGLKAKPELGHHSVVEPQPASQPAAEPAEKSGRSPDIKVTVLFPVWGRWHSPVFSLSILCWYNRHCPGRTSMLWFLCLRSKHVQHYVSTPNWWTAALRQSSEQQSSIQLRLKRCSILLRLFSVPGSEVEGRAYLRWSQVRRSHVRVPPTVQHQEAQSCCFTDSDCRSGIVLLVLTRVLTGLSVKKTFIREQVIGVQWIGTHQYCWSVTVPAVWGSALGCRSSWWPPGGARVPFVIDQMGAVLFSFYEVTLFIFNDHYFGDCWSADAALQQQSCASIQEWPRSHGNRVQAELQRPRPTRQAPPP